MSSKDCGKHGRGRRQLYRWIFAAILVLVFIVLLTILIIWAVLRPTKPRFILQDVTVYAFNLSGPNFLTSNFLVTVSSRNPNGRIGIYYDRLDIYASYGNQQITLRTELPTGYQGHEEINVWSPFIFGNEVPVSPYNAIALGQDQNAGIVLLMIKIDGRVRFKVGAFISGRYHLHVRCPAYITFGNKNTGIIVGSNAVKYQLVTSCSVSV